MLIAGEGYAFVPMALGAETAMTFPEMQALVLFVAGDMHEHLGQLIECARTNQIVPPWSR